jgi:hypothetical protein
MKKILPLIVACALTGCGAIEGAKNQVSPPVKMSAREIFDAYKLGKSLDGKRVEVTGWVRAAETDRSNGKLVLDGGIGFLDLLEVHFDGPVSGVKRGDTITATATVKGQVEKVVTLTDAKLVKVEKGKDKK